MARVDDGLRRNVWPVSSNWVVCCVQKSSPAAARRRPTTPLTPAEVTRAGRPADTRGQFLVINAPEDQLFSLTDRLCAVEFQLRLIRFRTRPSVPTTHLNRAGSTSAARCYAILFPIRRHRRLLATSGEHWTGSDCPLVNWTATGEADDSTALFPEITPVRRVASWRLYQTLSTTQVTWSTTWRYTTRHQRPTYLMGTYTWYVWS